MWGLRVSGSRAQLFVELGELACLEGFRVFSLENISELHLLEASRPSQDSREFRGFSRASRVYYSKLKDDGFRGQSAHYKLIKLQPYRPNNPQYYKISKLYTPLNL